MSTQDGAVAASAPITLKQGDQPALNPTLSVSTQTVTIGDSFTLIGSGFPANSHLKLMGGTQNPGLLFTTLTADGQGSFTFPFSVSKLPNGDNYQAGLFTFMVATQDLSISRAVTITLVAPAAVVAASKETVKIGDSFTLTGSGFLANAQLKLMGGVQNPGLFFTTIKTDGQGKFSFPISVSKLPDGNAYQPGPFTFVVLTEDTGPGKSVTVKIMAQ